MPIEKQTRFVTSDGTAFENHSDAIIHEAKTELKEFLDKHNVGYSAALGNAEGIYHFLVEHAGPIHNMLWKINNTPSSAPTSS